MSGNSIWRITSQDGQTNPMRKIRQIFYIKCSISLSLSLTCIHLLFWKNPSYYATTRQFLWIKKTGIYFRQCTTVFISILIKSGKSPGGYHKLSAILDNVFINFCLNTMKKKSTWMFLGLEQFWSLQKEKEEMKQSANQTSVAEKWNTFL